MEHNHHTEICRSPDREENNCILRKPKDCYHFHKNLSIVPILHQMIPVCSLPSYFLKTKEYPRDCEPLKDFATCRFYRGISATFQTLRWSIIHYRLSNTTYLIYSQLPSIPGGRFLHAQSLDVRAVVT